MTSQNDSREHHLRRARTVVKEHDVYKVEAIVRPEKLEMVKGALAAAGFVGLNIVSVTGRGVQRGLVHAEAGGEEVRVDMLAKSKIELVVKDTETERVIDVICDAARTGGIGDGKIFIIPVAESVRVRTGERGEASL